MGSGLNEADVKHAVLCNVGFSETLIQLEFISGVGIVTDMIGDEVDPLLFTVVIEPLSALDMVKMLEVFSDWMEDQDPIDLIVQDGSTMMHNTRVDFTIVTSHGE